MKTNKFFTWVVFYLCVLVASSSGFIFPLGSANEIKLNESQIEVNREFIGRTSATSRVELRARISGVLEERLFEEGRPVATGDTLYVIESDSYQASVLFAS